MVFKTLRDYMRHREGTYAQLDMSDQSKMMLDNFLNSVLDPRLERTDPASYHTTVIYSRTPVPRAEEYIGSYHDSYATPIRWEVFKTKNDGKCLVLKLKFPIAEHLNKIFQSMGATSDYPEYKPHVTVAYDFSLELEPEEISVPEFKLHFQKLDVRPLDPNYTPPKKEEK